MASDQPTPVKEFENALRQLGWLVSPFSADFDDETSS